MKLATVRESQRSLLLLLFFFGAALHSLASHIGHVDGVDVLFGRQLLELRDIRIPNLIPTRQ